MAVDESSSDESEDEVSGIVIRRVATLNSLSAARRILHARFLGAFGSKARYRGVLSS